MKTLKVLKLAGETGLRSPGTIYNEYDARAIWLKEKGFVSFADELIDDNLLVDVEDEFIVKEEKTVIETKEMKIKPKTKPRGRKPKSR